MKLNQTKGSEKSTWASTDSSTILKLVDIHTYYGESYVLHGVSMAVSEGSIVALLGRNGMGKTTSIRSIIGFTPPRAGVVWFKGKDITNEIDITQYSWKVESIIKNGIKFKTPNKDEHGEDITDDKIFKLIFINDSIFQANVVGFLIAYIFSYLLQSKLVFEHEINVPQDRGERVVELMSHVRGQFSYGNQFGRLYQLFLGVLDLLFEDPGAVGVDDQFADFPCAAAKCSRDFLENAHG